jgi:hypothetical protein
VGEEIRKEGKILASTNNAKSWKRRHHGNLKLQLQKYGKRNQ